MRLVRKDLVLVAARVSLYLYITCMNIAGGLRISFVCVCVSAGAARPRDGLAGEGELLEGGACVHGSRHWWLLCEPAYLEVPG